MMLSRKAPDRSRPELTSVFRLFFIPLLIFPLLYAFPANVSAQDDVSPDDVMRVRTDLVTVPVYVTDSRGRRVAGLTQSDFSLRDNGRAVTLSYFAAGTEHVALAFALDSSGSIREVINAQREAAFKLFSRFGRGSRIAVLHFGERAAFALPFTSDAGRAETAFAARPRTGVRTAIFDAVQDVLRAFNATGSNTTERRILILISDGLDTVSSVRPAAVIRQALDLGVSIYAIQLPLYEPRDGRLEPRPATKGFRDMAEKTGGRYFMLGDAKSALDPQARPELAPIFQAIEEDLQGQYVLGYYTDDTARATALHRIEINLEAQRGRKLRVHSLREEYNLKQ